MLRGITFTPLSLLINDKTKAGRIVSGFSAFNNVRDSHSLAGGGGLCLGHDTTVQLSYEGLFVIVRKTEKREETTYHTRDKSSRSLPGEAYQSRP